MPAVPQHATNLAAMTKPATARTFTLPGGGRQSGRDETERRILQATERLLNEGASLAELSVGRIVAAAGVSRATFYLHFADKRALVALLAEQRLSEFGEITDPFMENPGAGRDQFAEVVTALVATWREHSGVLSGLIELAEYDEQARETWQATVYAIAERMTGALRERRPELSAAEARTIAEIVTWMGERVCHQMIDRDSDARSLKRVAVGLTDTLWRVVSA